MRKLERTEVAGFEGQPLDKQAKSGIIERNRSNSLHEKEIAELLEQELGGEIFMVPRINSPQGVSPPDYLFCGKGYDLKTIGQDAGPKTILNRIKKA